jgi:pyruvate/2-oxoglutarate dehydrogenase complex dihydrolipoamide acyltransferase (E2) component
VTESASQCTEAAQSRQRRRRQGHARRRRVAADKGVDLAGVAGTGPGGQITKGDVLARSAAPSGALAPALPGDLADEPVLAVRRAAADYNINLRELAGTAR